MPLSGPGTATKPAGTTAVPNTTIESSKFNLVIDDIYAIFNTPRPIAYGGTNGSSAVDGIDNLSTKGTDIASAATTDIGAATGRFVHITGTTTITSLGTKTAGVVRFVVFDGALTLTHNATSLILPGAANINTAAGDGAIFISEGAGNWRCIDYIRASGLPVVNTAGLQGYVFGLTATTNTVTPASNIDISAGVAARFDSPYTLITLASAITKNAANAWAVGTGNGSLDTGSIANSTYYGYLIQRSDTGVVDVLTSLSSTSPTMPTNYDRRSPALFTFTRTAGVNSAPAALGRYGINYSTPASNPNTASVLFAGIPSGVKRMTAHFISVGPSASALPEVRLGSGGSVVSSGYLSNIGQVTGTNAITNAQSTTGILLAGGNITSANPVNGKVIFERASTSLNFWTYTAGIVYSSTTQEATVNGVVTLSGEPDRIQFTTQAGTALLNGTMNISWEF